MSKPSNKHEALISEQILFPFTQSIKIEHKDSTIDNSTGNFNSVVNLLVRKNLTDKALQNLTEKKSKLSFVPIILSAIFCLNIISFVHETQIMNTLNNHSQYFTNITSNIQAAVTSYEHHSKTLTNRLNEQIAQEVRKVVYRDNQKENINQISKINKIKRQTKKTNLPTNSQKISTVNSKIAEVKSNTYVINSGSKIEDEKLKVLEKVQVEGFSKMNNLFEEENTSHQILSPTDNSKNLDRSFQQTKVIYKNRQTN
jgi:hypothetical protein